MKTRYLFVCSVNRHRSRTADHFFNKKLGTSSRFQIKSCGTDVDYIKQVQAERYEDFMESKPITQELVDWADVILCMENEHANIIKERYGEAIRKKCYVLGIPDIYHYGSPELEMIFEQKVKWGLPD
jgi:predicted protein tyrosine phosphatase